MWLVWLITSKQGTDIMAEFVMKSVAGELQEELSSRWSEYSRQMMVINLLYAHGMVDVANTASTRRVRTPKLSPYRHCASLPHGV